MPEFTYIARDRTGNAVEGTVFADNSALAAGKVREMGYVPERVRAIDPRRRNVGLAERFAENFIYPISSGVPLKDLAVFYRQFATLVGAGIPLYQSLVTLEGQSRNAKLKGILRDCQQHALRGGKLSEVMGAYPWVFGELQLEMIRAAEQGGMLDEMLRRIADYLDQELELRRLISRLTLYPKLVVLSALFLIGRSFFSLSDPLVPAIAKLIAGTMGAGSFATYGLWEYLNDTLFFGLEIGVVAFLVIAFCRIFLFQSDAARMGYEQFKMAVPGLGPVVRGFALAKFGRAFGAMYAAGMPMTSAVRVGGNASGSRVVAKATERAVMAAERGLPLSSAFAETRLFPQMVVDMLRTGEQTGSVDAMMTKVADYLEGEASSKAHVYSHIFATAVYLVIAVLVAIAVVRFYSGYFSAASGAASSAGGE